METNNTCWVCPHCHKKVPPVEIISKGITTYYRRPYCNCPKSVDLKLSEAIDRNAVISKILAKSGLTKEQLEFNFDNFNYKSENLEKRGKKYLDLVKSFVTNAKLNSDNNLFIWGVHGVGKSRLAVSAMLELTKVNLWSCYYVSLLNSFDEIRATYNSSKKSDVQIDFFRDVRSRKIVLFDDVDKIEPTLNNLKTFCGILTSRANAKKPMIFTANKSFEDLERYWTNPYLSSEIADYGKAIIDRMAENMASIIEIKGTSYRRL